ncbi:hypothetical protein O7635_03765 [Asanoa sp. WMMD1127]|nr:hypothetical protein [Asanoa sp. WMMD1127]MDG4820970.1 hypothetical protein [Asanoa sp. WMMD1127]
MGFHFAPSWLTIFNALDQNGFEFDEPGSTYRRHPVETQRR